MLERDAPGAAAGPDGAGHLRVGVHADDDAVAAHTAHLPSTERRLVVALGRVDPHVARFELLRDLIGREGRRVVALAKLVWLKSSNSVYLTVSQEEG